MAKIFSTQPLGTYRRKTELANMKWKDKLVSSSFPLEYEAAKILVKNHFIVDSDYTYSRSDLGTKKDFSVDINATAYIPYTNDNKIDSEINILVECKQRKKSVKWLFLPDPNKDDFSSLTLGRTINVIDNFSKEFIEANATVSLDENTFLCYKGIEIDTNDGRVYDNELRHGLHQLQYALPRLLKENIIHNIFGHEEDNKPFFICTILLTTATLHVAKKMLTISKVEESSNIEDFSKEVPYLITYLDHGPDFKEHCKNEFKDLNEIDMNNSVVKSISEYRQKNGEYNFLLPENLAKSLQRANTSELHEYFTQMIVCNMDEFPNLIKEIKKITTKATRNKKGYRI